MSAPRIHWLSANDAPDAFPPAEHALREPDGLLAAGGDLSEPRLLAAYARGIFPWYEDGQPILWWSPDPRCVLQPDWLHVSRRSRRALRGAGLTVSFNRCFDAVIDGCAAPRAGQQGTWITPEMRAAYVSLHRSGWAHSAEIMRDERLIGGLYGIAIGKVFFAESMFSREANASKAALLSLCHRLMDAGFALIDCQVASGHLQRLGARTIPRSQFLQIVSEACSPTRLVDAWPDSPVDLTSML